MIRQANCNRSQLLYLALKVEKEEIGGAFVETGLSPRKANVFTGLISTRFPRCYVVEVYVVEVVLRYCIYSLLRRISRDLFVTFRSSFPSSTICEIPSSHTLSACYIHRVYIEGMDISSDEAAVVSCRDSESGFLSPSAKSDTSLSANATPPQGDISNLNEPLRIRLGELFAENVMAKILRTAVDGLVDNVRYPFRPELPSLPPFVTAVFHTVK